MAQLAGIVMLDPKDAAAKEQFFFGGIEGCRFRRPVVPGDTLVRPFLWLFVHVVVARGVVRFRPTFKPKHNQQKRPPFQNNPPPPPKPQTKHKSKMMRVEVTKFNKRFGIVKVAAKGYVGADLAVEAELTLAMGKAT